MSLDILISSVFVYSSLIAEMSDLEQCIKVLKVRVMLYYSLTNNGHVFSSLLTNLLTCSVQNCSGQDFLQE